MSRITVGRACPKCGQLGDTVEGLLAAAAYLIQSEDILIGATQ